VLYNLVDNTVKYAGTASNISLTWAGRAPGGCLIYRDDGQGIPVEDKEKIFQRGYGHNTGLGLFLAREILSFTDIQIVENGIPGDGARFEMTVPGACYRVKAR
jgi:signal transduction histidine kinase